MPPINMPEFFIVAHHSAVARHGVERPTGM
jgi:hypothetical protein